MTTTKKAQAEKRAALRPRIDAQCDAFAEILGVDAEEIMFDPLYGVSLTPDQADAVLDRLRSAEAAYEAERAEDRG